MKQIKNLGTKKLTQNVKTKKPKIPAVTKTTVAGYGIGSYVKFMNGGKIKKLTEYITERDSNDMYDANKTTYKRRVLYYVRVPKPEGKKGFVYEYIPLEKYDKYGLKNESKTLTRDKFIFEYNSARNNYSKISKVGGRCW